MQTDRTDNSLRPSSSGGTRGSGRLPPGFDTAASNLPVLGPRGDAGAPLPLKVVGKLNSIDIDASVVVRSVLFYVCWREFDRKGEVVVKPHSQAMQTSGDILKLKQEIEPELFLDDESWGLSDANSAGQAQGHYFGSGSRDWHGRSGQSTLFGDVKSWDTIYGNKESSQLNSGHEKVQQLSKRGSQFPSSYQVSSTQVGTAPALHKAEVAWSARRGNLRQKECVLKTVKCILNKLTPEKYDVLKGQIINAGITTPDILKAMISP
ncbi:hypothetical protein C4D60_Mb01t03920 [Musa balbisiana]|uniref:Uncharacterized protein n=1 Tax=Musa balbisiana TaxID=52838 RepID=A0A4S8JJP0_MUSBA|nr:hypothetical protein C4D60_Mb01t03920 [Musa balbisiana]